MKSQKAKFFLLVAVPVCALCCWNRGLAQQPDSAQTPASQGALQEIVVTAQKRSENRQNVPIAIDAIEGPTAIALGIKDTTDLQLVTPGLVMHRLTNSLAPSLRGISQGSAAAGDESPIALYVDGVYYADTTSGVFSFNNIQRIEVLKGPQGTLFGRNAAGGVIQVITQRPQQDPHADMSAGYSNYDTYDANLYATTGVTSNLATDLAVYWHDQFDGWGRNITTGAKTFTNQEFAIRNKWLLDIDESTHVLIASDYDRGINPVGVAKDELPGYRPAYGPPHRGGFFDLQGNINALVLSKQWGASAQVDHDFDWARLVSISAYRGSAPHINYDQDSGPINVVQIDAPYRTRQYTQEFQLLSPDASKIKWILGLFYLQHKADSTLTQLGLSIAPPATFKSTIDTLKTDSVAGFAETTAPLFSEDTHLTAGLRYTSDRQSIAGGVFNDFGEQAGSAVTQHATFDKLTWRAALDHRFTSQFMTYVSYNRGFKSGVYNATSPQDRPVNPSVIDAYEMGVKSEWLDQRLRLNGSAFYYKYDGVQLAVTVLGATHSLNAAKAEVKGSDLDIEFVPVDRLTFRGGVAYTDAKYTDFPIAPYATPKAAGGFTVAPGDGSGNEMIFTPKWTVSTGAQYSIPTEHGTYGIAVNYYYSGSLFPDSANQFLQPSYQLVNASLDWTTCSDKCNVKLWAKNLNDAHYYNHVTVNSLTVTGSPSEPRTFGITFDYKLGGPPGRVH
jgi:iron complex outermembrane recepter protein